MGFVRQTAFVAAVLALAIVDLPAVGDWITLDGCQLVPNPANDGDSVHVRVNEKEYLFRLYSSTRRKPTLQTRPALLNKRNTSGSAYRRLSNSEKQLNHS